MDESQSDFSERGWTKVNPISMKGVAKVNPTRIAGKELEEELRIKHLCSEYCSLFDFNSLFEILRANTRVAKWGRL